MITRYTIDLEVYQRTTQRGKRATGMHMFRMLVPKIGVCQSSARSGERGLPVGIQLWPFRTLFYKPRPIFGCMDPERLQKSLSRSCRAACRILTCGSFWVSPTCLVEAIPVQAFENVNSMRLGIAGHSGLCCWWFLTFFNVFSQCHQCPQ